MYIFQGNNAVGLNLLRIYYAAFLNVEVWARSYQIQVPSMSPEKERLDLGVSKNRVPPQSSILIGFSITNHPFWGTSIVGSIHLLKRCLFHWFWILFPKSLAFRTRKTIVSKDQNLLLQLADHFQMTSMWHKFQKWSWRIILVSSNIGGRGGPNYLEQVLRWPSK